MAIDGEKLRNLRIDKGWSQERLAELSNVHRRTIQRAERGEPVALETLSFLADALETSSEELRVDNQGFKSRIRAARELDRALPVIVEGLDFVQESLRSSLKAISEQQFFQALQVWSIATCSILLAICMMIMTSADPIDANAFAFGALLIAFGAIGTNGYIFIFSDLADLKRFESEQLEYREKIELAEHHLAQTDTSDAVRETYSEIRLNYSKLLLASTSDQASSSSNRIPNFIFRLLGSFFKGLISVGVGWIFIVSFVVVFLR